MHLGEPAPDPLRALEKRIAFLSEGADEITPEQVDEILARRRAWCGRRRRIRPASSASRPTWRGFDKWNALEFVLWLAFLSIVIPMVLLIVAYGFVLALVGMVLALAILGLHQRRSHSACRLADECRCPACRYEVQSIGFLVRSSTGEEIMAGPPCCPECGYEWPLVPPPV
jgi:hypothetical protein